MNLQQSSPFPSPSSTIQKTPPTRKDPRFSFDFPRSPKSTNNFNNQQISPKSTTIQNQQKTPNSTQISPSIQHALPFPDLNNNENFLEEQNLHQKLHQNLPQQQNNNNTNKSTPIPKNNLNNNSNHQQTQQNYVDETFEGDNSLAPIMALAFQKGKLGIAIYEQDCNTITISETVCDDEDFEVLQRSKKKKLT